MVMSVVKFSSLPTYAKGQNSIESLDEKIEQLKRDLEYILNNLDKRNFTLEFLSQNGLK